jgi:hypothetical protein
VPKSRLRDKSPTGFTPSATVHFPRAFCCIHVCLGVKINMNPNTNSGSMYIREMGDLDSFSQGDERGTAP